MQLVIQGTRYDIVETLSKPSLNDLYYLKVKTVSAEFPKGVSLKTMVPVMERMGDLAPIDIIDDAELLLNLRALVFLCRKHAGENVTLDSANDFPLDEFAFETEESDTVAPQGGGVQNPTQAPPASAPGAAALEAAPPGSGSPTT